MVEYSKFNLENYDVITARAVAQMNFLLEVSVPMLKIGKYFIAMKGNLENEIDYNNALKKLNCSVEEIKKFKLPIEQSNRTLIKVIKKQKTPKIFPRKYIEIKRNPL